MAKESFSSGQSKGYRREFLKTATGVAGGLLVGEQMTGAQGQEKNIGVQNAQELKRQRLEYDPYFTEIVINKIDFPAQPKPLTEEVRDFIKKTIELQNGLALALPIRGRAGSGTKIETFGFKPAQLDTVPVEFWNLFKDKFNFKGSYSRQDVNYALAYELPDYLAQYGIFVHPFTLTYSDQKGALNLTCLVSFHKIMDKQSEFVSVWGEEIKRDVFSIIPLDLGTRQEAYESFDPRWQSRTNFQNIFFTDPDKTEEQKDKDSLSQLENAFSNLNESQYLKTVASSVDQRQMAATMAAKKILNHYPKERLMVRRDTLLSHETGHLYHYKKLQEFAITKPPTVSEDKEYSIHEANSKTHDEIDAMLTEYKLSKFKENALMGHLGYLASGVQQDFAHDTAANWCIDRFINIIKGNPSNYAITIDSKSPVSVDNQIILNLPNLFSNPHLFETLADKAMEVHKKNYAQDFSAAYFAYQGRPIPVDLPNIPLVETQNQLPKQFPWGDVAVGAGAVTALGGVTYGLKKLYDRKKKVAKETAMLQGMTKTERKKYLKKKAKKLKK